MEEFSTLIRRGLTDSVSRQVIITTDLIKFEDKNFINDTFTTFLKDEIADYRYGVKWLRLRLVFGRQYCIFIRNKEKKILKIAFKSYFKHKLNDVHKQYCDILDSLYRFHFSTIVNGYIQKYSEGEEFTLSDVHFDTDGIRIKTNVTIREKESFIAWEDVRTKNYYSNFSIYSDKNPSMINRGYSYMEDWNTTLLYSVTRAILQHKNIETYN